VNELTGIMSVRLPVQTAGDGWVCGCVCVQKKEFPYIGEHQYIGAPACVVAYEPTRAEPIPRVCLCVCFLPCPYVTPHSAEVSLLHTPLTEVCVWARKESFLPFCEQRLTNINVQIFNKYLRTTKQQQQHFPNMKGWYHPSRIHWRRKVGLYAYYRHRRVKA
jgi:hypothetical protein